MWQPFGGARILCSGLLAISKVLACTPNQPHGARYTGTNEICLFGCRTVYGRGPRSVSIGIDLCKLLMARMHSKCIHAHLFANQRAAVGPSARGPLPCSAFPFCAPRNAYDSIEQLECKFRAHYNRKVRTPRVAQLQTTTRKNRQNLWRTDMRNAPFCCALVCLLPDVVVLCMDAVLQSVRRASHLYFSTCINSAFI